MHNDHFSSYSDDYAKFRPRYPERLIGPLCKLVKDKKQALDCGTGNGQVAEQLAPHFGRVYGIDISPQQMALSSKKDNVHYRVSPSESTPFPNGSFDLITAAQSYHWFEEASFWEETYRILKPGGIVALWGYSLLEVDEEIDRLIRVLYHEILGEQYWDPARKKVEKEYKDILFPCQEVPFPNTYIELNWQRHELLGYLGTWSAVRKMIKSTGDDPLVELRAYLITHWEDTDLHAVRFPLFGRIGTINQG